MILTRETVFHGNANGCKYGNVYFGNITHFKKSVYQIKEKFS